MNIDKNNELIEKYKDILSGNFWGFEIPNGWDWVVEKYLEKTQWDITHNKLNISIVQIKEKFGGLRVYLNDVPENSYHFIEQAERYSHEICEVCGEPGEQHRISGWVFTLCDEHRDEKLYVDYDGKKYLKKIKEPILNGDIYFNAMTNTIEICDKDNFFDPWSLKVVEVLTINDSDDVN